MTLLSRDATGARVVEDDPWIALEDGDDVPRRGDVIVSLARWRADREALRSRAGRVGLAVPGDTPPEELAPELEGIALVAVQIPKFTDGRAYSLARLLRARFGYRGALRARGDVLRDQLFYLSRCGFDSFELKAGKDVGDALAAFRDFSLSYQPADDHDQPIWRRRAAL
jgi:uncharacterized protein (DUF934 family)